MVVSTFALTSTVFTNLRHVRTQINLTSHKTASATNNVRKKGVISELYPLGSDKTTSQNHRSKATPRVFHARALLPPPPNTSEGSTPPLRLSRSQSALITIDITLACQPLTLSPRSSPVPLCTSPRSAPLSLPLPALRPTRCDVKSR